jgi:hypothetical protein
MSQDIDILSKLEQTDLSKIETSYPILHDGVVQATVVECQAVPADGDKKPHIQIKYTIAQDWTTQPHDGIPSKPVSIGFPITERVYLNDWEDPKTGEVKNFGLVRLAQFREAIFGKATADAKLLPLEQYIGQSIVLKLKFEAAPKNKKTGETYGPQTTVDSYIRKAS